MMLLSSAKVRTLTAIAIHHQCCTPAAKPIETIEKAQLDRPPAKHPVLKASLIGCVYCISEDWDNNYFRELDFFWSTRKRKRTEDGLLGTAKSIVNGGWLCSCSFVQVSTVQMFACLTELNVHANTCFFFLCGRLVQMFSDCCRTTYCVALLCFSS